MGIRNCADLGVNLQKIVKKLMANDELVKLLYYEDKDPLSRDNLSIEQKNKEIFNKRIKIIPRLDPTENEKSTVIITISEGQRNQENREFKKVQITVEVFVPITAWVIKDTNLRPFAILGEIQKSLEGIRIDGLGRLSNDGFELTLITDEMTTYETTYYLNSYV